MENHDVVVYISKDNNYCKKVIQLIEDAEVSYEVKNVSDNREYMKELQKDGIYGTPATFIKGMDRTILGYQKREILNAIRNL